MSSVCPVCPHPSRCRHLTHANLISSLSPVWAVNPAFWNLVTAGCKDAALLLVIPYFEPNTWHLTPHCTVHTCWSQASNSAPRQPPASATSCPAATPLTADQCRGRHSTCWSVGVPDLDCPDWGLCCFDGNIQMVNIAHTVRVSTPHLCRLCQHLPWPGPAPAPALVRAPDPRAPPEPL